MQCKVRKGGPEEDRGTGELLYSKFFHRDSRPMEGLSDPHWHVHCLKRNAGIERDRCERFSGEAACRYSHGQAHYTLRSEERRQNFRFGTTNGLRPAFGGSPPFVPASLTACLLQWLCRQRDSADSRGRRGRQSESIRDQDSQFPRPPGSLKYFCSSKQSAAGLTSAARETIFRAHWQRLGIKISVRMMRNTKKAREPEPPRSRKAA
jgi:hypothetical protein